MKKTFLPVSRQDMEKLNISWDADNLPELQDSDFKLIKKIGFGGMGSIYEAEQISLQRRVAIKILSPGLFADDKQKAQFVNEAKLIAQLHHPHIIKIIDAKVGTFTKKPFYQFLILQDSHREQTNPIQRKTVLQQGLKKPQELCGLWNKEAI